MTGDDGIGEGFGWFQSVGGLSISSLVFSGDELLEGWPPAASPSFLTQPFLTRLERLEQMHRLPTLHRISHDAQHEPRHPTLFHKSVAQEVGMLHPQAFVANNPKVVVGAVNRYHSMLNPTSKAVPQRFTRPSPDALQCRRELELAD